MLNTLLFEIITCCFYKITKGKSYYCSIHCNTVQLSSLYRRVYSIGRYKTKMSVNTAVFLFISNTVLCLVLAGQAPVSSHLTPTPLLAAYENHSRKWLFQIRTLFSRPEGVRLRELRLYINWLRIGTKYTGWPL